MWGNNPFHYVWDVDIESVRNDMLKILLETRVGCH